MSSAVELSPVVQRLAGDFQLDADRIRLSPDRLDAWCRELAQIEPPARRRVAGELVTLATQLARRSGDQAAGAVGQLFLCATVVLQSRTAAAEAFHQAGIDPGEAARLTGRKLEHLAPELSKPHSPGVSFKKK